MIGGLQISPIKQPAKNVAQTSIQLFMYLKRNLEGGSVK